MKLFSRTQGMGIAALIMAGSVFLSRFMGLIRDKVISYYHGATLESDIYFASFVIPDFLNYLLAGGYFSITLIPLLSEYFEKSEKDGWEFLSSVLLWVFAASGLLTGVAWLGAPWLARLAAPGFDAAALERLTYFLRIILPAQVFFLLGSCFSGLLYRRRQFQIPALTPLVYNAFIIGFGWLMIDTGMEGFCWGVLVGAFVGSFMLPLIGVWAAGWNSASGATGDESSGGQSGGRMRLRLCWRHAGVWRFALLALPLMIGQSIVVLDEQFIRIFGSLAGDGAVSLLNYARRIMLVPVGVVAQAAGVASYPFLASLVAQGDTRRFNETMQSALRNTLLFIVPLAAWMIAAAEPTIRLIFQQGGFSAEETVAAAPLLQVMMLAVAFWGIHQIVGRAFYANKDTVTPAVVGTLMTVVALPVYWLLGENYGAIGVAAAGALSVAGYTVALSGVWCRRFGTDSMRGLTAVVVRALLLAVPCGGAAWYVSGCIPQYMQTPLTGAFFALAGSGVMFLVLYAGTALLVMPDVLEPVTALLRRKLPVRLS